MKIGDTVRTRMTLSSKVGEGAQGAVTGFSPRYDTWEVTFEVTPVEVYEVYEDEVYVVEDSS